MDKKRFDKTKLFILKGEYSPGKYHDVLVVELNDKFYLIDPSVWQFFIKKRNMFIGEFKNMDEIFLQIEKTYGGKWGSKEQLKNFADENNLVKTIKININTESH